MAITKEMIFTACSITVTDSRISNINASNAITFNFDGRFDDVENEVKKITEILNKQNKTFMVDYYYIDHNGLAL